MYVKIVRNKYVVLKDEDSSDQRFRINKLLDNDGVNIIKCDNCQYEIIKKGDKSIYDIAEKDFGEFCVMCSHIDGSVMHYDGTYTEFMMDPDPKYSPLCLMADEMDSLELVLFYNDHRPYSRFVLRACAVYIMNDDGKTIDTIQPIIGVECIEEYLKARDK